MPDPYWEKVGQEIRAKKDQLSGPGVQVCTHCGEKFDRHASEKDTRVCSACAASYRKNAGAWRGKGSFGKRPVGIGRTDEEINEEKRNG